MPGLHPLKKLRLHLGFTQDALAKSVGLSQPFVSQVEAGESYLGRETCLAIADKWRGPMKRVGVTVEDLLRGSRQGAAA